MDSVALAQVTGLHVPPVVPVQVPVAQLWQEPVQSESQQTLAPGRPGTATHLPLAQAEPLPQGCPLASADAHMFPWQVAPAAQSVLVVQVVRQAVAPVGQA